jgi:hypothetical protein
LDPLLFIIEDVTVSNIIVLFIDVWLRKFFTNGTSFHVIRERVNVKGNKDVSCCCAPTVCEIA